MASVSLVSCDRIQDTDETGDIADSIKPAKQNRSWVRDYGKWNIFKYQH